MIGDLDEETRGVLKVLDDCMKVGWEIGGAISQLIVDDVVVLSGEEEGGEGEGDSGEMVMLEGDDVEMEMEMYLWKQRQMRLLHMYRVLKERKCLKKSSPHRLRWRQKIANFLLLDGETNG